MVIKVCDICEKKVTITQEYTIPMSYEIKANEKPRIIDGSHIHLCEECRLEIARCVKNLKERKNNDGR